MEIIIDLEVLKKTLENIRKLNEKDYRKNISKKENIGLV